MVIVLKGLGCWGNVILSFLYLFGLRIILFLWDYLIILLVIFWVLLIFFLWNIFEVVVLLINFYEKGDWIFKLLIIKINNYGFNLVFCGILEGIKYL